MTKNRAASRKLSHGLTLVELIVWLVAFALLSAMSWRAIDALALASSAGRDKIKTLVAIAQAREALMDDLDAVECIISTDYQLLTAKDGDNSDLAYVHLLAEFNSTLPASALRFVRHTDGPEPAWDIVVWRSHPNDDGAPTLTRWSTRIFSNNMFYNWGVLSKEKTLLPRTPKTATSEAYQSQAGLISYLSTLSFDGVESLSIDEIHTNGSWEKPNSTWLPCSPLLPKTPYPATRDAGMRMSLNVNKSSTIHAPIRLVWVSPLSDSDKTSRGPR